MHDSCRQCSVPLAESCDLLQVCGAWARQITVAHSSHQIEAEERADILGIELQRLREILACHDQVLRAAHVVAQLHNMTNSIGAGSRPRRISGAVSG